MSLSSAARSFLAMVLSLVLDKAYHPKPKRVSTDKPERVSTGKPKAKATAKLSGNVEVGNG